MADKQEKEAAGVCVCGRLPVTVKCKGRYLVACPATMTCTIRSLWKATEQEAIKSWNIAVQIARSEK